MEEHTLIQSYVLEKYFVSTIYRRASIPEYECWFYETMVWEWDKATRKRGKLVEENDSGGLIKLALNNHNEICKKFAEHCANGSGIM